MSEDARLIDLLMSWEEAQEAGLIRTPAEHCAAHPELLPAFLQSLDQLRTSDWLRRPLDEELRMFQEQGPADDDAGEGNVRPVAQIGRYRLDLLLGRGAFGQVWRGTDPELDRDVAIKIPTPHRLASPETVRQFLEEARRTAQLIHPGIVPVYDVGQEGGVVYIVSRYLRDGSLAEQQRRTPAPFEVGVAAEIVRALAEALEYAHAHGVVHGDVKPSNILMDGGRPLLADFGVAASLEAGESSGRIFGTPVYAAPELFTNGGRSTARTDIYALGVVLYQLLAGRLHRDLGKFPWGPSVHIVPPSRLRRGIPRWLDRVCLRALATKPEERYQSAGEFAAALQHKTSRWRAWSVITGSLGLAAIAGVTMLWAGRQEHPVVTHDSHSEPKLVTVDDSKAPHHHPTKRLVGHQGHVSSLTFLDDSTLFSAGYDGTVRFWDPAAGTSRRVLYGATDRCTHTVVPAKLGTVFYGGCLSKAGRVVVAERDLASGRVLREFGADLSVGRIYLTVSRDESTLACASDEEVAAWNIATGERCLLAKFQQPRGLLLSGDGHGLIVGHRDGPVVSYQLPAGHEITRTHDSASLRALAWIREGSFAVGVGNLGRCYLIAKGEGVSVSELVRLKYIASRQFCVQPLSGGLVAIGYQSGDILVWDIHQKCVLSRLKGHDTTVFSLAASPDRRTLASGDEAGVILLWDISGMVAAKAH